MDKLTDNVRSLAFCTVEELETIIQERAVFATKLLPNIDKELCFKRPRKNASSKRLLEYLLFAMFNIGFLDGIQHSNKPYDGEIPDGEKSEEADFMRYKIADYCKKLNYDHLDKLFVISRKFFKIEMKKHDE